ncbi:allatostatin-A receptor-like [Antennarius striatus]|uniref:allatostatin-A receptor-like n=1 Tax=Antennarius striatus TaxID=241820 RepID=UPI0035B4EE4A
MRRLDFSFPGGVNDTQLDAFVWYLLPTMVTVPPLGIPANALVIRLLLGKPGIGSTSEAFTLSLALFDQLFCCAVLTEYVVFLFLRTPQTANFLSWGLNQVGGPLLLCLLTLDSYLAVCRPLLFLQLKEPKLRPLLCVAVGVATALCCGLVKISSKYKWSAIMALLCTVIAVISCCSVRILRSLLQSGPGRKELHPAKRRAFKLVLTALVMVLVHYLPPVVEYLLRQHLSYFNPFSVLTSINYTFLSWGSVTQPLSYLIRTKQLPGAPRTGSPPGGATGATQRRKEIGV